MKPSETGSSREVHPDGSPPASRRILVVDDEEDLCSMMRDALLVEGYVVDLAPDGMEAMQRLREADYQVVVSDIRMPRLGGLGLLQAVRVQWPATRVVLMTGFAARETAQRALEQGAFAFLQKPFDLDELLTTVQRAVHGPSSPLQEGPI